MNKKILNRPFIYYFIKFKNFFLSGIIFVLITNVFEALAPFVLGKALDDLVDFNQKNFFLMSLFFVLLHIGIAVFRYLWRTHWGFFNRKVSYHLRNIMFKKFFKIEPLELSKHAKGALLSNLTNDTEVFRHGLGLGTLLFIDSLFNILIFVFMMAYISVELTWKCLILLPFAPFIIFYLLFKIEKSYELRQDKLSQTTGFAKQLISAIRLIKSYCQENAQNKIFKRYSLELKEASNRFSKFNASFEPALITCTLIGSFIFLSLGGKMVIDGSLSLGMFFAFFQYLIKINIPLNGFAYGFSMIGQALASFNRIKKTLCLKERKERKVSYQKDVLFESLRVSHLYYKYPGTQKKVLKDINLEIKKGQKVLILGLTGSGKTSLLNLLRAFYEAPLNTVFINDLPIEKWNTYQLNEMFSFLDSEAFVFKANIKDNISLFQKDKKRCIEVSEDAFVKDEILNKKNGFYEKVSENGVNLSKGQIQRISLARNLFRPSQLFIDDNGLSHLDIQTKIKLQKHLLTKYKDKTFIIVDEDLFYAPKMDQIILMNEGSILACGKHEDLLNKSSFYRKLYSSEILKGVLNS